MTTSAMSIEPFGEGSVSLCLYVHDLRPARQIEVLFQHAQDAVRAGFDGVVVPEHHGGAPTYLPNPLQVSGWLLDALPHGWAGPSPLLLPLRPTGIVIEELAWLAVRFPGRVGASFGAGYRREDFEAGGMRFEGRMDRFREGLSDVVHSLRGASTGSLAGDRAVGAAAQNPIPMIAAVKGPRGLALAGQLGIGVTITSTDDAVCREGHDDYLAAGGKGPLVLNRFAWLGAARSGRDVSVLPAATVGADADVSWGRETSRPTYTAQEAPELVEQLAASVEATGATALCLRLRHLDADPAEIAEQIQRVGREVVPSLRERLRAARRGDA